MISPEEFYRYENPFERHLNAFDERQSLPEVCDIPPEFERVFVARMERVQRISQVLEKVHREGGPDKFKMFQRLIDVRFHVSWNR